MQSGPRRLNRSLTLPAAARRNLDDILRHEIARHSPIAADDIYYDYRDLGRDALDGYLETKKVWVGL